MSEKERSPVVRFFGWLLMGIGALIAVTTGACTVYSLTTLVTGATGGSGDYGAAGGWALIVLLVGGIPCLVGVGLFFIGRQILKPPKPKP